MDIPRDVWGLIMVVVIGLLFIGLQVIRLRFDTFLDPQIRKVVKMDLKKLKEAPSEWRETFRDAHDFQSAMQALPPAVRLEIAEALLGEEEPFGSVALEVVAEIAIRGEAEMRRKAAALLRSDSIPPDRCISIGERIVARCSDSMVKIDAIGAMLHHVRDADARSTTTGFSVVVHAIIPCLADPDKSVRRAARDSFSPGGPLWFCLGVIDGDVKALLTTAKGPPLVELGYFALANRDSLIDAAEEARRRGIKI
jgi:hypothetical protein